MNANKGLAGAVLVVVAFTGCKAQSAAPKTSPKPVASVSPAVAAKVSLPPPMAAPDPSKFTHELTNPYFPLKKGITLIYEGTRDGIPIHIEMTVTGETKKIMGVETLVVRDIVSGALDERTTDWYAQDSDGNVWYFGEDTKEYENGVVVSSAGSWEAGVDGALPGVIMFAKPSVGGLYRQEFRPGVAEDVAKVQQIDGTLTTKAGTFNNVVVTEDTDLLDADKLEHKYYAPGVGMVKIDGIVNGHKEMSILTSNLTAK